MQQRVVIAMALAGDPSLLILDEPTTGLDVTTQARILELVRELRTKVRGAILYISYDLGVIAQVSDRVGILYAGELVETAPVREIFRRPTHPYTLGLLGALPDVALRRPFRPIATNVCSGPAQPRFSEDEHRIHVAAVERREGPHGVLDFGDFTSHDREPEGRRDLFEVRELDPVGREAGIEERCEPIEAWDRLLDLSMAEGAHQGAIPWPIG